MLEIKKLVDKDRELDIKRMYIPFEFASTCPNCGNRVVHDLTCDHYLSYPKPGVNTERFWCEKCDEEWDETFELVLELRPAGAEPVEDDRRYIVRPFYSDCSVTVCDGLDEIISHIAMMMYENCDDQDEETGMITAPDYLAEMHEALCRVETREQLHEFIRNNRDLSEVLQGTIDDVPKD